MFKKSKVYLGLMTVLFGTVIMVSTVFGQAAAGSSTAAPVKKSKNVNKSTAQVSPAVTSNSATTSAADSTKASTLAATPADSSVKKDSTVAVAVADSAKSKDSTVATADSAKLKDSTVAIADSAKLKDSTVTVADSAKSKDSTVAVIDSSTSQDSLNTAAVADSSVNTAVADSSKSSPDSAQTVQVDSTVTDTVTVAQATPEIDMSRNRNHKEYINTGLGLVFMAGTAGPQAGLIGSVHQFLHCTRPINVRAFFSFFSLPKKPSEAISTLISNAIVDGSPVDINASFKSKIISGDLLLDFHPFKNSFRLTAGLFFSGSRTTAKMEAAEGLSMEMINITPEEMGSIELAFSRRPVEPYLGIGTGNALKRRVSFLFDFGFAYTGALQIKGTGTGMIAESAENSKNFQNVFDKHNELFWWPVLSAGLGIKIF